eukprot:3910049-Amphidinium_carterae.3
MVCLAPVKNLTEDGAEENELLNFVPQICGYVPWDDLVVTEDHAITLSHQGRPEDFSWARWDRIPAFRRIGPLADVVVKLAVMAYESSSDLHGLSAFIPKQLGVALDP